MQAIGFYLFYIFCKPLSLLPPRVLYGLSDVLFVIIYHLVRYRKRVVEQNLKESFPEKSEKELRSIERKFYRHLCDVFTEYLILMGSNIDQMNKRMVYKNVESVNRLYVQGKDVILVLGHYGNWEWPCTFATYTPFGLSGVYKELHNKYFDRFFIKLRSKFGSELVEMNNAFRYVLSRKRKNIRTMFALIADQAPSWREMKYFTNFLNHPGTPIYLGPERIAQSLDMAIVFLDITMPKRGYYEAELIPLFENVKDLKPHEITEAHVRILEAGIRRQPELWLWTHKRWKRMEWHVKEHEELEKKLKNSAD